MQIGGVIGSLVGGSLSEMYGRKKTMLVGNVALLAGNITMAVSRSFSTLLIGRILTGLAFGLLYSSVPSYTPEIMQPGLRGLASTLNTSCYIFGFILTYYIRAVTNSWRILLFVMAAFPGICFIGVLMIPESPVWYCKHSKHQDAAKVL